MYPNIGSGTTQPSAPPPPSSSTLSNSAASLPVGFSSLMSQPSNQSTPYPSGQSSQTPYPSGQSAQTPYPTGPPTSSSSSTNPYPSNTQPPNTSNYSPYSLPGNQPPPPTSRGNQPYQASPYPQQSNPYQSSNPSSGYPPNQPPPSSGYPPSQPPPPSSGYPPNQPPPSSGYPPSQPPPPSSGYPPNQPPPSSTGYQNPYPPSNPYQSQQGNPANQTPYRPANPYGSQQGNTASQNPYQSQQGGYPQQPYQAPYGSNPQQPQQPYQAPYGSNPQQPPGGYGGYPPYNQQQPPYQNLYGSNPQQPPGGYPPYNQQQQQSYGNSYAYQPPAGGYNANTYGSPPVNDRIRSIAGRYEINDTLAQRLNILQQFEIVVLCDDSGSMNTPVDGTQGTRWDELRSIVQIVIEIGAVFDSNGVDVHFLNRPPMPNVTDTRQVIESFSQRPGGLTPLTTALRRIFQSAASKPGSDKRLLVFVATDGAPTDTNGNVDVRSLENLMRNERQANTTYVTFLACTDDEASVDYLSQWDRTMMNVDVVDDYKTEREEIRRNKGMNYPFSFGDYVAKALLGAVDPQMDLLDESANNNQYRRF